MIVTSLLRWRAHVGFAKTFRKKRETADAFYRDHLKFKIMKEWKNFVNESLQLKILEQEQIQRIEKIRQMFSQSNESENCDK